MGRGPAECSYVILHDFGELGATKDQIANAALRLIDFFTTLRTWHGIMARKGCLDQKSMGKGRPVAKKGLAPRKRRTRQHVIAAQSVNHVERYIIDEGHTVERPGSDYGYDLVMFTYDAEGYAEEGSVYLQLKATEKPTAPGDDFVFDVDLRDYALWNAEPMPVILVLFDASRRRAHWLYMQRYFAVDSSRQPRRNAKTVRVRIPKRQVVGRTAIRKMRAYKQAVLEQLEGAIDHG